jgi:hypothetical protein
MTIDRKKQAALMGSILLLCGGLTMTSAQANPLQRTVIRTGPEGNTYTKDQYLEECQLTTRRIGPQGQQQSSQRDLCDLEITAEVNRSNGQGQTSSATRTLEDGQLSTTRTIRDREPRTTVRDLTKP